MSFCLLSSSDDLLLLLLSLGDTNTEGGGAKLSSEKACATTCPDLTGLMGERLHRKWKNGEPCISSHMHAGYEEERIRRFTYDYCDSCELIGFFAGFQTCPSGFGTMGVLSGEPIPAAIALFFLFLL